MPKASAAKTAWVPKQAFAAVAVLAVGVVMLVAAGYVAPSRTPAGSCDESVRMGQFRLEVADELSEQVQGLSGRTNLPADCGLLFVYDDPGYRKFWMKDMHFPIDIVWVDADYKIVTIHKSVEPYTYPAQFTSTAPAQYVVELNAGQAEGANLQVGSRLTFEGLE